MSRTAPLLFGSPSVVLPSPAWGWPSEAQISYKTLLVQLHRDRKGVFTANTILNMTI
jgi:hypothetical protein